MPKPESEFRLMSDERFRTSIMFLFKQKTVFCSNRKIFLATRKSFHLYFRFVIQCPRQKAEISNSSKELSFYFQVMYSRNQLNIVNKYQKIKPTMFELEICFYIYIFNLENNNYRQVSKDFIDCLKIQ